MRWHLAADGRPPVVYRAVGTDTRQYLDHTTIPSYLDQGVLVATRYRYAVSSFTDVGVESAQSRGPHPQPFS